MSIDKRNVEGLTFSEWLSAVPSRPKNDREKLRQAWLVGEDPTEHEAAYQNARKGQL